MNNQDPLTYVIIGAAMEVYNTLGPGLLESVYHRAMLHELALRGLQCKSEWSVPVEYKGVKIADDLRIDILVEDRVVVELKSVSEILPIHYKQIRTYMKLMDLETGVLINFNESDFKNGYRVLTLYDQCAEEFEPRRKRSTRQLD